MNVRPVSLNDRAWRLCEELAGDPGRWRLSVVTVPCGARIIDFGVDAAGGLEAGLRLAEICMAALGRAALAANPAELGGGAAVHVATDHPLAACMAAQYAGWQITGEKFFAMGSGPMRALARREPLFETVEVESIAVDEASDVAVGVLESGKLPSDDVCRDVAAKCGVDPRRLTLCVARTASLAGTVQVVARSVETALHKLHELGFDLRCVESGCGLAPLPPVAKDDLAAIGRTNDAVLYGGHATLWVRCEDAQIAEVGPRVPSSASADHGRPFAEIFSRYGGDFYKIDPLLFSPAMVTFHNLASGRSFRFGRLAPDVLAESFGVETGEES